MTRLAKRRAVAASAALAVSVCLFIFRHQIWTRLPGASVRVVGAVDTRARVFRSLDGRILVDTGWPGGLYIVARVDAVGPLDPEVNAQGFCVCDADNDDSFDVQGGPWFILTAVAGVSTGEPEPCEGMPGVEDVVPPKLWVTPHSISFVSPDGKPIVVRM